MKKFVSVLLLLFLLNFSAFANEKTNNIEEMSNVEVYTELLSKLENSDIPKEKLAELYYKRGYFYETENDDLNNALSDYATAIRYNPKHEKALFMASKAKNNINDIQGALADMKQLIKFYPNNAGYHELAALLYTDQKDYNAAIKESTQAIIIQKKNPSAFYLRGLNKLKIGDESGLKDLEYAKQQYYGLNDIENYRKTVDVINKLQNYKTCTYSQPIHSSNDNSAQAVSELKKINENLQEMNQNSYKYQPSNNNLTNQMILEMFKSKPQRNNNIDAMDLYMLFGY